MERQLRLLAKRYNDHISFILEWVSEMESTIYWCTLSCTGAVTKLPYKKIKAMPYLDAVDELDEAILHERDKARKEKTWKEI